VKGQLVRYISHEMRTPLNAACLGLSFLQDSLFSGGEFKAVCRHDNSSGARVEAVEGLEQSLKDVKEACEIAVNFLNELLTFDKLESGLMKLEVDRVAPLELITESLRPLQIQVPTNS